MLTKWPLAMFVLVRVAAGCSYSDGTCSNMHLFECELENCINDTSLSTDGLDLDSQSLLGTIPPALFSLTTVAVFTLDSNALSGTIPPVPELDFECTDLSVSRNQLTGTVPTTISNLVRLQFLKFGNNLLTGSVPPILGSMSASLAGVYVHQNSLEGTLPSSISSLTLLQGLYTTSNQLSSTLPSFLGSFSALMRLRVGENLFSGTIPSSFGSISTLQDLSVFSNALTGTIPPSVCSLTNLKIMELHDSGLSGPLPSAIGSLVSLTTLTFSLMPNLEGIVPDSMCNIVSSLEDCVAGDFVAIKCPTGCRAEFALKCDVQCPDILATTEGNTTKGPPIITETVVIALSVSIPFTVVVVAIVVIFWLRSRSRESKQPAKQLHHHQQGGAAMEPTPSEEQGAETIVVEQNLPTVMSFMKQHILSSIIGLLPNGMVDEQNMRLVGAGGFGRVYVSEVGPRGLLRRDVLVPTHSSSTALVLL